MVQTQYVVHEVKPGVSETFTVIAANAYGSGPTSTPWNRSSDKG